MYKITGKQSMTARSLLKWNIYDLAHRVKGIAPKRIDSFEHGQVHFMEWENKELVTVFKKAGILFKTDLEVVLHKREAERDVQYTAANNGSRIVLDSDQTVLADSTEEKLSTPVKPKDDEDPQEN